MGAILIILFGLFMPRLILFVCYVLGVFVGAWSTCLWPVLGFIFLPYATLAWGLAHTYGDGVRGLWLGVFIVAILFDLSANGKTAAGRRTRR